MPHQNVGCRKRDNRRALDVILQLREAFLPGSFLQFGELGKLDKIPLQRMCPKCSWISLHGKGGEASVSGQHEIMPCPFSLVVFA